MPGSFGLLSSLPIKPSPSVSGPLPGVLSSSNWSVVVISAMLLYSTPAVGANTSTSNVNITGAPTGTVKPVQVMVLPVAIPPLLMAVILS